MMPFAAVLCKTACFALAKQIGDATAAQAYMFRMRTDIGAVVPAALALLCRRWCDRYAFFFGLGDLATILQVHDYFGN